MMIDYHRGFMLLVGCFHAPGNPEVKFGQTMKEFVCRKLVVRTVMGMVTVKRR